MNVFKSILSNLRSRVWFVVTVAAIVFFLVINILLFAVFAPVFDSFFGGKRPILADSTGNEVAYVPDYQTKTEAREAGNALNIKLNEEGIVLLKNKNNALPFNDIKKISVFGKNSVNLAYGGSGSGGGNNLDQKTLTESLTAAGYEINTVLEEFYKDNSRSGKGREKLTAIEGRPEVYATGETPQSNYIEHNIPASYADSDAALIVISRIGGEGSDLPRTMNGAAGARDPDDHYLQLDKNETDLISAVCGVENFKHVVVVINSSNAMELGFLDDPEHYAYNEKIDGALMVAGPGSSGIMALGNILNGEVNPSGRLVDTFARDFKKDPTWINFSNNLTENGGKYIFEDGIRARAAYAFVDYEEGIYSGHRYYETRGYTEGDGAYNGAVNGTATTSWDDWYQAHVVFPFGYGLGYSDFSWDVTAPSGNLLTEEKMKVTVDVTNDSTEYLNPGKDVVQLYVTAPYTVGGLAKAHKTLVGFAKTSAIAPGETASVEIEFDAYNLASYDIGANDGKGAFVLDQGTYKFWIGKDIHTTASAQPDFTLSLNRQYKYDREIMSKDPVSGEEITLAPAVNRFGDADDQLGSLLSRDHWETTWPQSRTTEERTVKNGGSLDKSFADALNSVEHNNPYAEANNTMPTQGEIDPENKILHKNMIGLGYDDKQWEALIDQLSISEMLALFNQGAFKTADVDSIGKPLTYESDGPVGFANFMLQTDDFKGTCTFASEVLIAQTWNTELAFAMGKAVGNEALIGTKENVFEGMPYSGWYAPGMNIHRTPFCGRNFEYYAEDSFFSGVFASNVVAGARSKGVYAYVKHFAVNEQETDRSVGGLATWLDEQTLREVYLRQFEICIKDGNATGVMSSFNRIGTKWTGGDYRLLTEVLRDEWGFRGTVISDFSVGGPSVGGYMDCQQMAYAGGDLNLTNENNRMWTLDRSSATYKSDINILRQCAKNILYTTANSNLYNVEVTGYGMPIWTIVVIVVDCVAVVGLAFWGFFAIRKSLKKRLDE